MAEDSGRDLAILLNENAKRVSARLKRSFRRIAPQLQLYSSRSLEEARQQVWDALDKGYRRIVCGGGDGTIIHVINAIREYVDEKNARLQQLGSDVRGRLEDFSWPEIGILKLGTGNGWADVVGSMRPKRALKRLVENRDLPTRTFNLVESEDQVFHFSGLGYDAAILNDYCLFKSRFGEGILGPMFKSLGGYLASMAVKTIPEQLLRRDQPQVRATLRGGEAFSVSHSGGMSQLELEPGGTIYEGPINVIGAATTPYYGYRLCAFPFATKRPGFFNLRIVKAGVIELVTRSPWIWSGSYESPNFLDFLAQDVHLEFDRPMPLQIGGDSRGYRREMHYRTSDVAIDVVDLHGT